MNWNTSASYNEFVKERFHRAARSQLRKLAKELGLERGAYDLRSNQGGIAVSGEITLHTENVYVQVSQSVAPGGILIRTCKGRRDYTGGQNYFRKLELLDEPAELAAIVKAVIGGVGPPIF